MVIAFLLISAGVGTEDQVLAELRRTAEVKEALQVFGPYDMIARVEAESNQRLKEVIDQKIRKLDGVKSTVTLLVQEPT